MLGQAISLTLLNTAGRAVNFLLFWIIANQFGVTPLTDWFFFIYAIINFVITILIKSVENVFVPLLNNLGEAFVPYLFRNVLRTAYFGSFVVLIIVGCAGSVIAPLLGLDSPKNLSTIIAVYLVLAVQPGIALVAIFFSSILQYHRQYLLPTIQLSVRALGILPLLFCSACINILGLAIAYLMGEITRLIVIFLKTSKHVTSFSIKSHEEVSLPEPILHHISWVSLALASTQINPIVDLAMVGNISTGAVTLVDYAGRFRGVPILALGGIMTFLLGEWSHLHYKSDRKLDFARIYKVFGWIFILSAVLVAGLMVSINLWLPLVFYSNKFTSVYLENLRSLFFWYLPGIPMLAGYMVFARALLVLGKTRILAVIAGVGVFMNIILNLIFIKVMGLEGVAFSTSCVDFIVCLIPFFYLKFRLDANKHL